MNILKKRMEAKTNMTMLTSVNMCTKVMMTWPIINYGMIITREEDKKAVPLKRRQVFMNHCLINLGLLKLDEKEQAIAEQIVGSIDEDGYLRRETSAIVDDLAFRRIFCLPRKKSKH